MRQQSYETIIACINHGAAAIAPKLIEELNEVVTNSNTLIQQRIIAEQEAKKAAEVKPADVKPETKPNTTK